ncbi:MAG: endonuclease [Ornithinimicrobium sp.]
MTTERDIVSRLLARHGVTFAEEAGIRLRDKPSPLYRLLVLSTLLSARIKAGLAVAAARELSAAGYRTPQAMCGATWQERVDALGRGGYRRYDERTASQLGDGAQLLMEHYRGDLRRLRETRHPSTTHDRLQDFPGIGPTGATIFSREVQGIWRELAPSLDAKVLAGAERLGLPSSADALTALVSPDELPRLAAGCVRANQQDVAADILGEA